MQVQYNKLTRKYYNKYITNYTKLQQNESVKYKKLAK